jgi:hypothetical protein
MDRASELGNMLAAVYSVYDDHGIAHVKERLSRLRAAAAPVPARPGGAPAGNSSTMRSGVTRAACAPTFNVASTRSEAPRTGTAIERNSSSSSGPDRCAAPAASRR